MDQETKEIADVLRQKLIENSPKLKNGKTRTLTAEQEHSIWMKALGVQEGKKQGREQGMVQGLCIAIAGMLRGESVEEIWRGAGLTLQECVNNGVDEYDMEVVREHFREKTDEEIDDEENSNNVPAIPPDDYTGSISQWSTELISRGLWDGEGWYGDIMIDVDIWCEILERCE